MAMLRNALCLLLVIAAGCGGSDGANGASGSGSRSPRTDYAPSRFAYQPGVEGRAVGIHARAMLADGEVSSHELEIVLLAPAGSSASASDAAAEDDGRQSVPKAASAALCSTQPGQTTEAFETLANRVCWLAYGSSAGKFSAGGSVWTNLFFTREGRYIVPAASMDVYVPPDLGNFSNVASVGCLASSSDRVPVEYLASLRALGASTSISSAITLGLFPVSVGPGAGITVYLEPNNHLAAAVQYDTTLAGVSVNLIPLPVSIRLQTMSTFLRDPIMVGKSANACSREGNPFDDGAYEDDVDVASQTLTFGAAGRDPSVEFQAVADELIAPLLDHLSSETGFGPSEHMMAGSNADAFASLGGPGVGSDGTSPPSTFDDLVSSVARGIAAAADDQDLALALARDARHVVNVVPSPALLDDLLRHAAVGIELAHEGARMRDSDPFAARELVRIEGSAGEEIAFTIEAAEIASLLGADEAAVLGATLKLSATHTLSDSEHELEQPTLTLSFTPENAVPLLVRVAVDLSTAQGPFDATLEGVEPQLAHRLIVPKAGAPVQLALTAAGRVAAGGAVTLNAVVADAQGNPAPEHVEVEFFDGDGASLGRATAHHGVASLQYVPVASEPVIDRVVVTELMVGDETVPGISIEGSGFSVDAEIRIDGEPITSEDTDYNVQTSSTILVARELAVGAKVQIVNPGGAMSGQVLVDD